MSSFFTSVEFYVVAVIVAAAIVAYMGVPRRRGPARQELVATQLTHEYDTSDSQCIELTAVDDGSVEFVRHGLRDLTDDGAVSLAIEIAGFDITVTERIVYSRRGWPANTARARFDFLASERYHLHYVSPDLNLTCATTLHNRPGIHIVKQLV